MKYNGALTGLRALAILAVVSSHVLPTRGFGGGWIGVDVFFVLSGYLITTILVKEWDSTGSISLKRFFGRRALRLYPALLLMLAVAAVFAPVFGNGGTASGYLLTAAITATYMSDIVVVLFHNPFGALGHTWSLAVEEHFYLVWPLVLVACLKMRWDARWAAVCGMIASLALLAITGHRLMGDVPTAYYSPQTQACAPLLGCLLALSLPKRSAPPPSLGGTFTAFCLAGLLAVFAVAGMPWAPRSSYLFPELVAAILCTTGVIAGIVCAPSSKIAKLLTWNPLQYVGRISYGWYLYHLSFIVVLDHYMTGSRAVMYAVAIPSSFLAAALSYRYVERPFLKRKEHLALAAPHRRAPTLASIDLAETPHESRTASLS